MNFSQGPEKSVFRSFKIAQSKYFKKDEQISELQCPQSYNFLAPAHILFWTIGCSKLFDLI